MSTQIEGLSVVCHLSIDIDFTSRSCILRMGRTKHKSHVHVHADRPSYGQLYPQGARASNLYAKEVTSPLIVNRFIR